MFIIFDLDDTLIDTSGYITPFKIQQCAKVFGHDPQALSEECSHHPRTEEGVISFALKNNLNSRLNEARAILYEPLPKDFEVPVTPHAMDVIAHFNKRANLALVTVGSPLFQREKLKKSGIDSSLFSMIKICERADKTEAYEEIQEAYSLFSRDVWVCGDRIETDLRPGHALGYRTIHMRWGRGKGMEEQDWIDHSIVDLEELKDIIK